MAAFISWLVLAAFPSFLVPKASDVGATDGDRRAQAWRELISFCVAEVCNVNHVEEDAASGHQCKGIPVRSVYGGIGRTTAFGRALWCIAQVGAQPILDLYAGDGDTVALLMDGILRREEGIGRGGLVTFEINEVKAAQVSSSVRGLGAQVVETIPEVDGVFQLRSAIQMLSHEVGLVVALANTSAPLPDAPRGPLQVACDAAKLGFGLVLVDPDVERDPRSFAQDWIVLEDCQPTLVAIYNTNLPGGAGWVRERLLHLGAYVEISSGHNDGGSGETNRFHSMRAWSILFRVAERQVDDNEAPGAGSVVRDAQEARSIVDRWMKMGGCWTNTTFRGALGGAIKEVHPEVAPGLVPVVVERPTDELLKPPDADTNPYPCLAEIDPRPSARSFRVPCFLTCEGPDFDPQWAAWRRMLVAYAEAGWPFNATVFEKAST